MSSYPLINDIFLDKKAIEPPTSVDLEYSCYAAWHLPGFKSVLAGLRSIGTGEKRRQKRRKTLLGTHFARMNEIIYNVVRVERPHPKSLPPFK
jgi:hypothetical protein